LIVDLKGHVGKKRWLGAREVVWATAIEDLVVVLDLENEVIDNALSHLNLAINEKSEGDEIGIPVVELCVKQSATGDYKLAGLTDLVETSARYDERDALESSAATPIVDFVHGEGQNARFAVQTLDKTGVTRIGREDLDVQV
jgi:hypothetical protein